MWMTTMITMDIFDDIRRVDELYLSKIHSTTFHKIPLLFKIKRILTNVYILYDYFEHCSWSHRLFCLNKSNYIMCF